MQELVIYGSSDDLIEIESTVFRNEEFNVYLNQSSDSVFLAISDGTVLRVRYDEDGIWRFTPLVVGSSDLSVVQGVDDDEHTDRVTLTGENLTWVALAAEIVK